MTIRILLADDHTILRNGLCLLLNNQPNFKVVAEASNATDALRFASEFQPDIILLDISMPGLNGLEALPMFRHYSPTSRVIVLTMHEDEGYVRKALQRGAVGYLLKRAADTELISAIHSVLRGDVYVHSSLTKALLQDVLPGQKDTAEDPRQLLSEREFDVLQAVAMGYTSAEIAEKLSLSAKTVETYRARGMEKLNLRSRAALVQFALSHGWLKEDL